MADSGKALFSNLHFLLKKTILSDVHPMKARRSINRSDEGMTMFVRDEHPTKASILIRVTEDGISIFGRDLHS